MFPTLSLDLPELLAAQWRSCAVGALAPAVGVGRLRRYDLGIRGRAGAGEEAVPHGRWCPQVRGGGLPLPTLDPVVWAKETRTLARSQVAMPVAIAQTTWRRTKRSRLTVPRRPPTGSQRVRCLAGSRLRAGAWGAAIGDRVAPGAPRVVDGPALHTSAARVPRRGPEPSAAVATGPQVPATHPQTRRVEAEILRRRPRRAERRSGAS